VAVTTFDFATAGRIMVGAGRAAELPAVLAGLGSRALVCTGANPSRHAGLLAGLGLPAAVFPVAGEPTVEVARAGVAAAREQGADVVAAIGGGSVIDAGKAVAMLLGNGGDPLDYLEVVGSGRPITRPAVPCVAVPTTAGTGAEVTANAVLAVPAHRLKASLRSPLMIPRVALVDPLLTVSCPPPVTAASGLDAVTQCLEPFVSVRATPLTDGPAREGLRRGGAGLRAAYAGGGDLQARTDMAVCSLLGGIALANAKLGAVHGLAGVIGGTADVPHGMACAALLAPVIDANVRALRSVPPGGPGPSDPSGPSGPSAPAAPSAPSDYLHRYAEAARLLTGNPAASIEDGLAWIRETLALLAVPGLAAFGLKTRDIDDVAAKAMTSSSMQGNPAVLSHDDLKAILVQAL
jgi:alcohol dehydrogenase class IV